jgi:uncharacterized RDD family membrane protein YckC
MRWPFRRRHGPRSLRRCFVTPEGVDLQLELGSGGARAGAFVIDALLILLTLIVFSIAIMLLFVARRSELLGIVWLIGFFLLRNGWFAFFEMSSRGATPGKRLIGLRVVARDGARLTGGAVIARNAMREIELFLPLTFLLVQAAEGIAGAFLIIFGLLWSGIFLFFPLFNADRLRVGDLVAGTWVVRTETRRLAADLAREGERPRRRFSEAALGLYGVYELQTLEEVLRSDRPEAIAKVADIIRRKAGLTAAESDRDFLLDYYGALCERLEQGLMVGRRRENKNAQAASPNDPVLVRPR